MLGANLGSGLLAMLTTLHSPPEARRVTLGNFLFKLIGCVVVVPLLGLLEDRIASLVARPGEAGRCCFHLLFNVAIAVALPLLHRADRALAERLLPAQARRRRSGEAAPPRPVGARHAGARDRCAAREALRIGDVIEQMLNGMLTVLKTNDRALAERLRKMDDVVDDLYTAVKLYLTQISREALEEKEGRRWADIVSFTINMEQVGDIIERIIIDLEDKKIDKGRNFSEAGHGRDLRPARPAASPTCGSGCACSSTAT